MWSWLIESTDAKTTDGLIESYRLLHGSRRRLLASIHVGSRRRLLALLLVLLAIGTTVSIARAEIEMDLMLSWIFLQIDVTTTKRCDLV